MLRVLGTGEWGHGGMTRGFNSRAAEDFADGQEEYVDIEREAGIFRIPDIHGKAFRPTDGIAAIDLSPASESTRRVVTAGLFRGVKRQVVRQKGSGTDEAELPPDDSQKAGEFIE